MSKLKNKVAVVTGASKGKGASNTPLPTGSVYSATKAVLDAITIALSKELGSKNIRINSILPGVVETAGSHSAGFIAARQRPNWLPIRHLVALVSRKIAKVAVFLASDDAAWITGEKISIPGGIYGL